jgi:hypothetical protein
VYKDKWNDVTVKELYKVIELMVLIGVYKSKNKDFCQLWNLENGRPIFNKIMSRQRFQKVLRVRTVIQLYNSCITISQRSFSR